MLKEERMKFYRCMRHAKTTDLPLRRRRTRDQCMTPPRNRMKTLQRKKMNLIELFCLLIRKEILVINPRLLFGLINLLDEVFRQEVQSLST